MIGVASLSLAACGSSGGESTDPARLSKVKEREEAVTRREAVASQREEAVTRREAAADRAQAAAPSSVAFPGLAGGYLPGASIAIKEVADTHKVQLTGPTGGSHPRPGRLATVGLQLRDPTDRKPSSSPFDLLDTKLAKVSSSKNGQDIVYSFALYTPAEHNSWAAFSVGLERLGTNPFEHEIFSLENNDAYTSVRKLSSIASQFGTGWDYSALKASVPSVKDGAKDATLYAEVWTDRGSAGVTNKNYMSGGWWLLVPNNPSGDYRFGILAKAENYYPRLNTGAVKEAVLGTATYKGTAAGLHTSSSGGVVSIQRLLGKVTLNADFGNASARGSTGGHIGSLTLDGRKVPGEILLPSATLNEFWSSLRPIVATNAALNPKSNLGNINGTNFKGDWGGTFQGDSSGVSQPTGIVGVVSGSGGNSSFVASFGAKKTP